MSEKLYQLTYTNPKGKEKRRNAPSLLQALIDAKALVENKETYAVHISVLVALVHGKPAVKGYSGFEQEINECTQNW